ncbi:MAG TPA: hypothetical protein VFU81_02470, partial [Thermomicrobiales bacterium]|nr:hypothetical protein [Thermomicrobiales bacterium]
AFAPLIGAAKSKPKACLALGKRCSAAGRAAASHDKGKRGGKRKRRSCGKCCSQFGAAGADGKTRCACKDDGQTCASSAECCGGDCTAGICGSCPSPCAAGQRCKDGQCICDGESCPNGCCQSQTCQTGRSLAVCGSGGAACQACGQCRQCSGGNCVAANESQCCNAGNGLCRSGQCVDCGSGQRCGDRACVCNGQSCPDGCCDRSNTCQSGSSDGACGTDGQLCQACRAPQTCGGGDQPRRCGCTEESDDVTCAGKCGTVANNCGRRVDCTPRCPGCCSGATCLPGTSDDACGAGGAGCQICHAPQTCAGDGKPGACGCKPNCAGKGCGADDGCGGKCRCPQDSPICLNDSEPSCCCPDNGLTNVCVANETDPTVVCCCPSIGGPTPYCRLAPSGKQCCCTNPDQTCTDSGCQTP